MNYVRLVFVHPGIAEFKVTYGEITADIKLDGLETTGGPEDDSTEWEPYYRRCLEELCAAIQAQDAQWKFSGRE